MLNTVFMMTFMLLFRVILKFTFTITFISVTQSSSLSSKVLEVKRGQAWPLGLGPALGPGTHIIFGFRSG
jgi:hypothetical protein